MHLTKKEPLLTKTLPKKNIPTPVQPLTKIRDYEPQFIGPQYQRDPYCDGHLYDEKKRSTVREGSFFFVALLRKTMMCSCVKVLKLVTK